MIDVDKKEFNEEDFRDFTEREKFIGISLGEKGIEINKDRSGLFSFNIGETLNVNRKRCSLQYSFLERGFNALLGKTDKFSIDNIGDVLSTMTGEFKLRKMKEKRFKEIIANEMSVDERIFFFKNYSVLEYMAEAFLDTTKEFKYLRESGEIGSLCSYDEEYVDSFLASVQRFICRLDLPFKREYLNERLFGLFEETNLEELIGNCYNWPHDPRSVYIAVLNIVPLFYPFLRSDDYSFAFNMLKVEGLARGEYKLGEIKLMGN